MPWAIRKQLIIIGVIIFLKNSKINYQFSGLGVYPKAHECSFIPL